MTGGFTIAPDAFGFDRLVVQSNAGTLRIDGTIPKTGHAVPFDIHMKTDALDLPVVARFVPAAGGIPLHPSFSVSASGPADRLGIDLDFRSRAGNVGGHLVADLTGGARRVRGTVQLARLNLAPFLKKPAVASDITASVQADATFGPGPFSLTYQFQAPSAMVAGYQASAMTARGRVDRTGVQLDASGQAYGGRVTSTGRLIFPAGHGRGVGFDLNGRTTNVDLSLLPRHLGLTKVQTGLNLAYRLTGEWPRLTGQFALDRSTAIGAAIAPGGTAGFSLAGDELQYAAAGELAHLDLQRVGRSFDVDALTADRYRSDLSGQFDLHVTGTRLDRLALHATTRLLSSSVFDGRIQDVRAVAHLQDRRLSVQTTGAFRGIDLVQAFAIPQIRGRAGGTVDGTVVFDDLGESASVDNITWNGAIDLSDSTLEGLPADRVSFDGRYAARVADIRRLTVSAPMLQGEASGTLDLTDTGASHVAYHVAQLDLARLGERLGRALSGLATGQGTLTGNRRLLQTTGHLTAAPVAYDTWQAIDLAAQYTAELPAFDRTRVRGTADVDLETLMVSAHTLADSAVLHAGYDGHRLDFRGSVQNPRSTLSAAGTWRPAGDGRQDQSVDLHQLTVATPGVVWQLAEGAAPHVAYGAGRLSVSNLRLRHGRETITAGGTLGAAGESLRLGAANIDLGSIDRLFPQAPPMAGTLESAAIDVSGTLTRPVAEATLRITGAAYRSVHDIGVTGTGRYQAGVIGLDVRLDQPGNGTMSVSGHLPATMVGGAGAKGGSALDLTVKGQQMALGLVSGLTTTIANVSGTVDADLHITGTPAAPAAAGTIAVANGAFTVPATGVRYTGLAAGLTLVGDRVRIDRLTMRDPRGHVLRATGALAIRAGKIGMVQGAVRADNFAVLDNDLAAVDIDANVQMLGELRQPRLQGAITLRSARLDADRLLALVSRGTTKAAPLLPIESPGAPAGLVMGPPEPAPSLFGGLAMDLTVAIPDNLVVTGSDLTGARSPVGIGSLHLTLGGTVRLQEDAGGPIRIAGTMHTVRGSYAFQGRRFEIQQGGQIQFRGQSPIDPVLNIGATLAISGVQTRVNVEGALRTPRLVLSSSPPLDEADILSLIVFNQPLNQLGEQQQASLVSRASLLAAGALASSVAQSIGRALNLDIFEIEPSPATGATAAVTIGQQIGSRLFLKVSQSIGRESATQFTIDYFLTSFMRLQSEITQGPLNTQTLLARTDRTSVELVFFFSY